MDPVRLATIREVDNRNATDMLRWREAEIEALRRRMMELQDTRAEMLARDV